MGKNIFIEGMQGTGKSTLLTRIVQSAPEYAAYREGDLSPAELAWCSYMTGEEFLQAQSRFPDLREEILAKTREENGYFITAYTQIMAERREFYEYMEQFEIYNGRVDFPTFRQIILKRYEALAKDCAVYECSFLQNSIESMMLFYQMGEEEILSFYTEAFERLKSKGFLLFYLDSDRIRENVLRIKRERSDENGNEMWYPLMLKYLCESPYGREHHYQELDDMITHFERRRRLELRIVKEVLGAHGEILAAKQYDMEQVIKRVRAEEA